MSEPRTILSPLVAQVRELERRITELEQVQAQVDDPVMSLRIAELLDRHERLQARIAGQVAHYLRRLE